MGMLYQKCSICQAGTVEPEKRLSNGHCPGCDNKLYVPIGMTARQLERISVALKALIGERLLLACDAKDLSLRVEQKFSAYAGGAPCP